MTAPAGEVTKQPGQPWRKRILAVLAVLGPGLIAANAGNDAGGILTYASAGAQFAYRTLFLMVLVTVALVVVQEMCSRLGVYTGEGLGGLIREQFSARSTFIALLLLLVANAGLTVSEFAGVGAAMQIFGVPPAISVPIAAILVWCLTVLGSYSRAERLFMILTLAFLAYPVAAFLGHPDGKQVAANLVWPHFVGSHDYLVLAVALIGTTITPYMQFYVASAVVDKGIKPADYHGERIDTVSGAIWSDVIAIFIIVATAAAIGGSGPLQSAAQAAEALRPAVGPAAPALFAAGLLGASLLAASIVPLSTSYAIADATGTPRSVSASLRQAPLFYGVFTLQIIVGAAVALAPGNLVALVVNAQVLNGIITPLLLTYVLILANRSTVLGTAKNGPIFKALATVCVAVVGLLSFVVLVETVFGLG
ncbi:divalent metal cation transporter [Mycobacterium sp. OTB74]|uniref:NRAMP family divalent metal transporter n=1 Tax=Mycobacterium sp. OTB74 TaxID=1853452 RepID=UPI0024741A0F|nr:divalent metal cation transporter [Mycobacterium sp. OTB74]MDH6245788.1 Mn2+/Fe2+ NRAMP family transporter [Mycobacterium sp. OTB74]